MNEMDVVDVMEEYIGDTAVLLVEVVNAALMKLDSSEEVP